MKILIVDDDPKLRDYVSRGLTESGFQCETAADGESALALLRSRRFDLALLDVMLPGIQGWDVMEAVHTEGISVPVIWVTARDALEERVRGLHMGGDDYVVKPSPSRSCSRASTPCCGAARTATAAAWPTSRSIRWRAR